jgi:hypothetical protein
MKKPVFITIVALLALLILGFLLFRGSGPAEKTDYTQTPFPTPTEPLGSDSSDIERFVTSFYEWYFENISRDTAFPYSSPNKDDVLRPWLTTEFIAQWDDILHELEVDPVLITQEDPSTWDKTITAKTSSLSRIGQFVTVTIGSGDARHSYNVNVVKIEDGSWKIAAVEIAN